MKRREIHTHREREIEREKEKENDLFTSSFIAEERKTSSKRRKKLRISLTFLYVFVLK